uniref:Uncharacterized protein n=1 Tax=Parascaris univalens TaxID=6257 RepID=A0A915A0Q2_PARUN
MSHRMAQGWIYMWRRKRSSYRLQRTKWLPIVIACFSMIAILTYFTHWAIISEAQLYFTPACSRGGGTLQIVAPCPRREELFRFICLAEMKRVCNFTNTLCRSPIHQLKYMIHSKMKILKEKFCS